MGNDLKFGSELLKDENLLETEKKILRNKDNGKNRSKKIGKTLAFSESVHRRFALQTPVLSNNAERWKIVLLTPIVFDFPPVSVHRTFSPHPHQEMLRDHTVCYVLHFHNASHGTNDRCPALVYHLVSE